MHDSEYECECECECGYVTVNVSVSVVCAHMLPRTPPPRDIWSQDGLCSC